MVVSKDDESGRVTRVVEAGSQSEKFGPVLLAVGCFVVWTYACFGVVYGIPVRGHAVGAAATFALFGAGCIAVLGVSVSGRTRRWLRPSRMAEIGLALLFTTGALLVAETVYAASDNARRARAAAPVSEAMRMQDATVWHGELFPRSYFPTRLDFAIYKPNVRLTAVTYGEFYTASMLRSRTLVDSVLEKRPLSYFIGPHGFRELESLASCRVFALGDSFVLGYATDEGSVWTDVLGLRLGEPVYNLGMSSTGPRPQLSALEYLLETQADSVHVGELLWMLFEGNDLENSYALDRPARPPRSGGPALFDGTVFQVLASIPGRLRNQSILRKLMVGDLRFGARTEQTGDALREIDGVKLDLPLYHSDRFGYKLFNDMDVARATRGREYVHDHPNVPALRAAFREMKALADRHGFHVTVVVAPSAARLYGEAFDGFPTLSTRPWFVDYLVALSDSTGFSAVNLLPLLAPYAQDELLYYRDDHHWNVRGNALVAELLEPVVRRVRESAAPAGG